MRAESTNSIVIQQLQALVTKYDKSSFALNRNICITILFFSQCFVKIDLNTIHTLISFQRGLASISCSLFSMPHSFKQQEYNIPMPINTDTITAVGETNLVGYGAHSPIIRWSHLWIGSEDIKFATAAKATLK